MADLKIVGRVIRAAEKAHKDGSATQFITLVKDRGTYVDRNTNERKTAQADFITLRNFVQNTDAGKNQGKFYADLAAQKGLVEAELNIKGRPYESNGQKLTDQYLQVVRIEPLESKDYRIARMAATAKAAK